MARSNFSASSVRIKVVGLGGGGSNAVTRMVRDGVDWRRVHRNEYRC